MKRGVVGMTDYRIDDLYNIIRNRRIELNMTQTELAQKVGYTDKGMVSRVENGKVDLSQSQIIKFAEALDIDPGTLMGWNDVVIEKKEPLGDRGKEALLAYAKQLYENYQKASPEIQKAVIYF
jgi:transcriptional regulator with XRE-family HTH domain